MHIFFRILLIVATLICSIHCQGGGGGGGGSGIKGTIDLIGRYSD